jgi:hypothetical protein
MLLAGKSDAVSWEAWCDRIVPPEGRSVNPAPPDTACHSEHVVSGPAAPNAFALAERRVILARVAVALATLSASSPLQPVQPLTEVASHPPDPP